MNVLIIAMYVIGVIALIVGTVGCVYTNCSDKAIRYFKKFESLPALGIGLLLLAATMSMIFEPNLLETVADIFN